jgi:NAD(P)H-dependent flavin oxidoreductase YrpB (nitropropane dioxygenase family)
VLVPDVVDAIAPVPVLAAGGIGSGRQMAAAMALGADGVWTGSIWLTTQENGTGDVVMDKLLHATSTDTVRSRALTGKPARQLRTGWTEAWEAPESPGPLPMPLQFILNSHANRKMGSHPPKELVGMPVGQIVSRMNEVRSAKQVVFDLVEEYVDVAQKLADDLAD